MKVDFETIENSACGLVNLADKKTCIKTKWIVGLRIYNNDNIKYKTRLFAYTFHTALLFAVILFFQLQVEHSINSYEYICTMPLK